MRSLLAFSFAAWLAAGAAAAETRVYDLTIGETTVTIDGKSYDRLAINGTIPGPLLTFTEGDEAVIRVTNTLDEPTSLHWHGLKLPGIMDGVTGFNGYPGIAPGATFTYRFPIRQAGTYWYHSHTGLQEQDGLYAPLVIMPKAGEVVKAERDYVVMLSDIHPERGERILRNLKVDPGYYNKGKRTVIDFFRDAARDGLGATLRDRLAWGEMRMDPTDLADVTGYTYLLNGRSAAANQTLLFSKGEKVRLRFINGNAMSFMDVRIPGLKMIVVAADASDVQPVPVDEFRMGIGETYDVIVIPDADKAYTIFAEAIDRSGYVRATLAPREGMTADVPEMHPRALLTMDDMGAMPGMDHGDMAGMDHGDMAGMDHAAMDHNAPPDPKTIDEARRMGWAAGAPPETRELSLADLKALVPNADTRPPVREITVTLGGNMERYIWLLNGKPFEDSDPIQLKFGERVRITYVNETMMAHPMHLHGPHVQVENGQPPERLPTKHVVVVPPGKTVSVLLTADEPGDWALHCHLLNHMVSGMMAKVSIAPEGTP
ncbi:Copper resistance protein A [Alphaproteobacteria bacterium SO-S41]|nr:Copper resistance protein A [Alphaproteobacteria bacterium SO-S41]